MAERIKRIVSGSLSDFSVEVIIDQRDKIQQENYRTNMHQRTETGRNRFFGTTVLIRPQNTDGTGKEPKPVIEKTVADVCAQESVHANGSVVRYITIHFNGWLEQWSD